MKSLYIHIPFCCRKCFYCSFVIAVGQSHRADAYLDCLLREAAGYRGEDIKTVYIGGGTPTFLEEYQLERLLGFIENNFNIEAGAEYTFEANPESADFSKIKLLKSLGVNRLSLGIQTLDDHYLQFLGRNHDRQQTLKAYGDIRKAGFDNVSMDMMFSFPRQTARQISKDVQQITALNSEHLSLYMLNLEENSRFFAQGINLPDEDSQARQYRFVREMLGQKGFLQYEISNFAKSGRESVHNLNYWQGGDYIGLGVGAHSYMDGKLSWNSARLSSYMSKMEAGGSAAEGFNQLDSYQQFKQAILIGLRMNKGVCLKDMTKAFGCCLNGQDQERIGQFLREGLLCLKEDYLKTTPRGQIVLDELCARLI